MQIFSENKPLRNLLFSLFFFCSFHLKAQTESQDKWIGLDLGIGHSSSKYAARSRTLLAGITAGTRIRSHFGVGLETSAHSGGEGDGDIDYLVYPTMLNGIYFFEGPAQGFSLAAMLGIIKEKRSTPLTVLRTSQMGIGMAAQYQFSTMGSLSWEARASLYQTLGKNPFLLAAGVIEGRLHF